MKTILVTGGAGFIGSNFIRMVLTEHPDCSLVNLDTLTYAGNLENLADLVGDEGRGQTARFPPPAPRPSGPAPRYCFVHGDICDGPLVGRVIEEHGIDAIINFAAESHVDRSITGPKIFIETNVTGTLTLLEAARDKGVNRFVQISTDEVYGALGPLGKFTEQTLLCPNSPYSASKAAADHLVRAFGHTWGLQCNITRCSNNYGPYQFPEKLIPLMIHNALHDKELPVYGDGMQVRDWLYVYDHCTAIWQVLEQGTPGEIYNIGGGNEKPNLEVVEIVLARLGKPKTLIRHVKDRPGHDRRYAIDAGKIMSQLGWRPSVTFEQGIVRTIDWYLNNEKWLAHVVSGQYQQYYETMYGNR